MLLCTLYVVCKVQDYWDCSDYWVTVIKKLVVRFVWETELSVTHRSKLIQLLLLVLNKQKPPTYYELLIMQMTMRKMFACEANEKIEYSWIETSKISFLKKNLFFCIIEHLYSFVFCMIAFISWLWFELWSSCYYSFTYICVSLPINLCCTERWTLLFLYRARLVQLHELTLAQHHRKC